MEQEEKMHADPTVQTYRELLESGVYTKSFYAKMIEFTYKNRFFFAPYVEILDYLESLGLKEERDSLLHAISRNVLQPLTNYALLARVSEGWDKRDAAIFMDVLARCVKVVPFSLRLRLLQLSAQVLYQRAPEPSEPERRNLILMRGGIDVTTMQRELERNEVCWTYDTSRQDHILVHQRTNAIVLRNLATKDTANETSVTESTRTPLAEVFPATLGCIEAFARERGAVLGRVALVRLQPHSKVYRHYDSEPWLQKQNRYHLVIYSRDGSTMTSGVEQTVFHEGDLFFFDNKKMHTAENSSNDWRVHVIFDMYDSKPVKEA